MLTSVALLVCQVRVVDPPLSTALGLAVSEAVGAAGGGGGGGGGGATFFLQAPSIITAPITRTSVIHFIFGCFTFSSLRNRTLQVARGSGPANVGSLLHIAGRQ